MSDFKVTLRTPPENPNPTDEQKLEVFTQVWAQQASAVLRAHLDSASIKGPAAGKAAFDELVASVTGRLIGELARDHWDSKYVRALFPKGAGTKIEITNVLPDYDTVQEIVRDEQGRAAQIRTTKRAAKS